MNCRGRFAAGPAAGTAVRLAAAVTVVLGCGGTLWAQATMLNPSGTINYKLSSPNDSAAMGYQRIEIEVAPVGVIPAPLRLQFEVRNWTYRGEQVVSHETVLPAGAGPTTVRLLVPCWSEGYGGWQVLVTEANRTTIGLGTVGSSGQENCILFINNQGTISEFVNLWSGPWSVYSLDPHEFEPNWLAHSTVGAICLKRTTADELARDHKDRWRTLLEWTAAGGVLVLLDVEPAQLADVDGLLGFAPGDVAPLVDQVRHDSWTTPPRSALGAQGIQTLNINRRRGSYSEGGSGGTEPADPLPLWFRRYGLGTVVALQPLVDEQGWTARHARNVVVNYLGSSRLFSGDRFGIEEQWGWGSRVPFRVPGIGEPPVAAFCILISVFVIGVGPVNYFWLRRKRKLYLMLATVPLAALVVTSGLVTYAVVTEGFGTYLHVRSYTFIDQRSAVASNLARVAYWATTAPGAGLVFPDDVAVVPPSGRNYRRHNSTRTVLDADGTQRLVQGYLRGRQSSELTTIVARPSQARLDVRASGDSPPEVRNRLGSRIVHLLLADEQGNLFAGGNIAPDGTATLKSAALPADWRAFNEHFLAHSAKNDTASGYYNTAVSDSLLETTLSDLQQSAPDVGRRGYLAIVERAPLAEYGLTEYEEVGSFHVVRGQW